MCGVFGPHYSSSVSRVKPANPHLKINPFSVVKTSMFFLLLLSMAILTMSDVLMH